QQLWSAAQNRGSKQQIIEAGFVSGLAEIEIVAVRRKRERSKWIWRGRDDLGITGSGHIAEPEAFEAIFAFGEEQVFSVRRNCGEGRGAGVCGLSDGELRERFGGVAGEERSHGVSGAGKQNEDN